MKRIWWRQFRTSFYISRQCGYGCLFSVRHAWRSANHRVALQRRMR